MRKIKKAAACLAAVLIFALLGIPASAENSSSGITATIRPRENVSFSGPDVNSDGSVTIVSGRPMNFTVNRTGLSPNAGEDEGLTVRISAMMAGHILRPLCLQEDSFLAAQTITPISSQVEYIDAVFTVTRFAGGKNGDYIHFMCQSGSVQGYVDARAENIHSYELPRRGDLSAERAVGIYDAGGASRPVYSRADIRMEFGADFSDDGAEIASTMQIPPDDIDRWMIQPRVFGSPGNAVGSLLDGKYRANYRIIFDNGETAQQDAVQMGILLQDRLRVTDGQGQTESTLKFGLNRYTAVQGGVVMLPRDDNGADGEPRRTEPEGQTQPEDSAGKKLSAIFVAVVSFVSAALGLTISGAADAAGVYTKAPEREIEIFAPDCVWMGEEGEVAGGQNARKKPTGDKPSGGQTSSNPDKDKPSGGGTDKPKPNPDNNEKPGSGELSEENKPAKTPAEDNEPDGQEGQDIPAETPDKDNNSGDTGSGEQGGQDKPGETPAEDKDAISDKQPGGDDEIYTSGDFVRTEDGDDGDVTGGTEGQQGTDRPPVAGGDGDVNTGSADDTENVRPPETDAPAEPPAQEETRPGGETGGQAEQEEPKPTPDSGEKPGFDEPSEENKPAETPSEDKKPGEQEGQDTPAETPAQEETRPGEETGEQVEQEEPKPTPGNDEKPGFGEQSEENNSAETPAEEKGTPSDKAPSEDDIHTSGEGNGQEKPDNSQATVAGGKDADNSCDGVREEKKTEAAAADSNIGSIDNAEQALQNNSRPELPEDDSRGVSVELMRPAYDLVNTKGMAVDIPIKVNGPEGLDWHFIPTAICPDGLKAVVPAIAGIGSQRSLVLAITGAEMKKPSADIFITVVAWARSEDGKILKATAVTEMKIHRPGIEATKDKKGNITVKSYTDSNLNGIAEVKTLTRDEYTLSEADGSVTVTALDEKLGFCVL